MKSKVSVSAAQALLIRIARIAWAMYATFVKRFNAFLLQAVIPNPSPTI